MLFSVLLGSVLSLFLYRHFFYMSVDIEQNSSITSCLKIFSSTETLNAEDKFCCDKSCRYTIFLFLTMEPWSIVCFHILICVVYYSSQLSVLSVLFPGICGQHYEALGDLFSFIPVSKYTLCCRSMGRNISLI